MGFINRCAKVILVGIFGLLCVSGLAQERFWVGGSGSWNDPTHWSYTSGGKGGAAIPSGNDVVNIDRNSFIQNGAIALSGNVSVKELHWSESAANSGFQGNYEVSISGSSNFSSKQSWAGTIRLTSSESAYVAFSSAKLALNLIFEPQANYSFITGVSTSGKIEVKGLGVNFMNRTIKANPLVASTSVKTTAKTGFFKSTNSNSGKYKITASVVDAKCPGGKDGKISIDLVENGTPPYTYQWRYANNKDIPGATSSVLENLAAGDYIAKIGEATGDYDLIKIHVSDPVDIEFKDLIIVEPTCNGSSTGSLKLSLAGGTSPYTYSLNNGVSYSPNPVYSISATGLSAGTYGLLIKDKNLCDYTYPDNPIVIKQPAAINLTLAATDVSVCFGNNDGTITATATGGLGALEYSKDGGPFSPVGTFTGLIAGTYTITARSSVDHACVASKTITVNQPVKLSASVTANPVSGCSATPDGQIIISNEQGGSGLYDYTIDGGKSWATSGTFTGLSAGTYNVMIRDRNNPTCQMPINPALVLTAKPALTATYTSTNVTCNGSANGTITFANPQGGSGVYEYNVSGTWVSTPNFINLAPNTYTLQIRDKNSITCSKTLGTVIITEPAALSATISKTDVTGCYNANNGTITIKNSAGGSGQYEYSVDGAKWDVASTITGLFAGSYPVSMRDKLATTCVKPLGTLVITAPVKIAAAFTKVDVTGCAGNNNGSITFKSVTGGSGQYEYSVDNGGSWSPNAAFNGLFAKAYTLVVRDKITPTCNSPIGVANIIEPTPMSATVSQTNVTCFGTSTGTITVTNPKGGSGTYRYSKDGGATWQPAGTFTNLPAGTYQMAIQDATNLTCTKNLIAITITQSAAITATVNVTNVAKCFGDATGAISVTNPVGGSGNYEYSKDGAAWGVSSSFPNLTAETYPIFIRDVANKTCSVKLGDYKVDQPANIVINSIDTVDPKCFGESNGSITVNATGGTAPLNYSSNGGPSQFPNLFPNLAAGSFTITVKDNAGCTKQSDVTLNNPGKIIPAVTKVDVTCAGPNTGQIDITVTGGKAPYLYSIYGGTTGTYGPTASFTGIGAGNYNVRVKDANGCESDIVTVTVKGAVALDVTASTVDVKPCSGDKTGSINLTINSGTAPYQYNIGAGNKPLTGTSITGLAAGNYNLTITDGAGCVKNIGNVTVGEPAPITATATVTDVIGCSTSNNGSIFVAAGGGVTPLSYSKDNGVSYGPSNNFTGLSAGTYPIKVKDANGCIFTVGDKVVKAPNALTIDLAATTTSNVKCNGDKTGSVTIVASGGVAPLSYTVNTDPYTPSNKIGGLGAGSYTIKVKDNGGCEQTAPINITEPNAIVPNVQAFNISCSGLNDGRILVAPTGGTPGYTVTLNPVAPFVSGAFSNLVKGNYTVTVTDANSCAVTKDVTLNQPTPITITSHNFTNPTCSAAGTITVVAAGGTNPLKYSLIKGGAPIATNADGKFTNVAAGVYTVEVTDANNCAKVATPTITLTSPSSISFSNIVAPAIICNGGTSTISLTVSGIVGTPTVVITKGGVPIPAPTVTKVGANYTITTGNLAGGNYIVSVSDSNDPTCKQTQAVDIVEPAPLALGTPVVVPPSAGNANGSISVIATGGTAPYTYKLTPSGTTNATGIFSNLGVGNYTISVSDVKGCGPVTVDVTLANLTATLSPTDINCNGAKDGKIDVTIAGGVAPYDIKVTYPDASVKSYTSPTATYQILGLDKGNYSLVITDVNGTSVTKSATINEPAKLAIALQNATATLCSGAATGKIDVAVNGGTNPYIISWTGDNAGVPVIGGMLVGQTITNLAPASYVVTVTDSKGCATTANHTIAANPALNMTVKSANPVCGNPTSGTITLTTTGGTAPYSYTNDGIAFNNTTGLYTALTAGTYTVAVKDGAGCESAPQTVVLTTPTAINIASVVKTDTKCAIGGTITVTAAGGSGVLTYNLLRAGSKVLVSSNTNGLFTDVALGNYLVEVTDGGTCPATWPTTISIVSGGGATKIKVINYTVDNIKCFGDKGRAVINVSGVQGALTCVFVNRVTGVTLTEGVDYFFKSTPGANAGEFTIEVSGFSSGNYNMFISDDNACPQKFPFGISGPSLLKFDSLTKVDPSSKSSADGTITAVVSGGVKPYTYKLEGTSITSTTGIFTGLNPGKYKVVVEDKNHCLAVSDEIELIAKSNLSIDDVILVNPKCHAEQNGSIDIYASGGSGVMKYSIDNGKNFSPDHLFPNLKAGVYDIIVEDALGVRATKQVTLVDPEAIVVKVVKMVTPSADGAYNGSIVVIATGGSGLYSYSLVNADTGDELSNATTGSVEVNFNKLPSGNYKVIVTDENGCIGEVGPIALEELKLDVTVTDVKCSTDKFGKLDIAVKGGVEPFKLTWQPKGGTVNGPFDVVARAFSIADLAAGDYVLSVTDATNSVYTTTVTINSPVALVANVKNATTPICAGTTDGTVELDITGGKPVYTIAWTAETPNPGSPASVTGNIISGLHPSKYAITVTDANGCSTVVNTEIASYPEIVIDKIDAVQPKCNGNLGSVNITASGGVGELTYSTVVAGKPVTNKTGAFSDLPVGTYTISITDTKACVKKSADVVIVEPAAIVLTITEALNQTCTSKGKIVAVAAGGVGKITYSIGAKTNDTGIFDDLDAGKFTVTATDETGCSASKEVEIISTATLKITNLKVVDVKCFGGSTGQITFNVEGASAGLVVTANGNVLTPDAANLYTIDNLKVGVATIEIKDDSGCSISEQHNIAEPTEVKATIKVIKVPANPTDNSGSIEVVATGGSGFYKITCLDKASGSELSNASVGEGVPTIFNKLLFGTYTILVEDDKGCSFTGDITIGAIAAEAKGIGGSCKDPKGSIEVTITNGAKPYTVTYTKKGDPTILDTKVGDDAKVTFAGVDPGDYTVKVVDNSNFEVTLDVTVPVYTAPAIGLVAKCFVNGEYYIEIKVPDGLKNYTVKCTDADGVVYAAYDLVRHRITALQPNKTYTIYVVDEFGCESDKLTVDIATLTELKMLDETVTNVLCRGAATGAITLKASGGTDPLKYELTPKGSAGTWVDSPVFIDLKAQVYTAYVGDAAGCFVDKDITITEPDTKITLALDLANSNINTWCATSPAGVISYDIKDGVPGYEVYLFKDKIEISKKTLTDAGNVKFDMLKEGTYAIIATDKNGCNQFDEVKVTGEHIVVGDAVVGSECKRFVNKDDAQKLGGSIEIKSIGGNFAADATYFFKKEAGFALDTPVTPNDGLQGDGFYPFTAGTSRTISQLSGLSYTVMYRVVEARGVCEEGKSYKITVKPENDFEAFAYPKEALVCLNSNVTYGGGINASEQAQADEVIFNGEKKANRYFCSWSNLPSSPEFIKTYKETLDKDFQDQVFQTVKITKDQLDEDRKVKNRYIFKVVNHSNLCYDVDTTSVIVYPFLDPYLRTSAIPSLDKGGLNVQAIRIPKDQEQEVRLVARHTDAPYSSITWMPENVSWLNMVESDDQVAIVNSKFTNPFEVITVTVNTLFCTEVLNLLVYPQSGINPPNAITPNGDGFNDSWRVVFDEELLEYPNLEVEIFNRWGSLIYHAKPYKNNWDGRHNGTELPTGTYYYVIKPNRGNLPAVTGSVSIIR